MKPKNLSLCCWLTNAVVFSGLLAWMPCEGQGTLLIDFEGPPEVPPGSSISYQAYYQSGLLFTPVTAEGSFSRVGAGFPSDPQNGTAYLSAAIAQSLRFGFTNGWVFNLMSVDLAEYSALLQGEQGIVSFVGYRQDGTVVNTSLTLDGIIDGTGPLADFQTFYFGPEFSNLTRVEVPTWGWSLDNLRLSVPEPTTASIGIVWVVLWRLFRKRLQGASLQ